MGRSFVLAYLVTAAAAGVLLPAPAGAQDGSPLAGAWTLNRSISELPREIGFNVDWISSTSGAGQNAGSNGGRRGRGGSGSGGGNRGAVGAFAMPRESSEDARRVQLLTAEVR